MADRENLKEVIDGLRCAIGDPMPCAKCRYREYMYSICKRKCAEDAIALLKAQEARVMTLGEVRNWVNSDRVTREPVVIEIHGGICAWIIDDEVREIPGEENLSSDLYGKTWRCWTSRPIEAEREATPWD